MEMHRSTPGCITQNQPQQHNESTGQTGRDASAARNGGAQPDQDMVDQETVEQKLEAMEPANAVNFEEEESKDCPKAAAKKAKPESKFKQTKQKVEPDNIVIQTSIDMETISDSTIAVEAIAQNPLELLIIVRELYQLGAQTRFELFYRQGLKKIEVLTLRENEPNVRQLSKKGTIFVALLNNNQKADVTSLNEKLKAIDPKSLESLKRIGDFVGASANHVNINGALVNAGRVGIENLLKLTETGNKQQLLEGLNLLGLDPQPAKKNLIQSDEAIEKNKNVSVIMQATQPEIMQDRIACNKYACYFKKCRKTFQTVHQLVNHQKIHNFRPFTCEFEGCGKSFMSKGHLKNHSQIHALVKQYVCPIQGCKQSYSRIQRLQVHIKKHNGCRDFVCPFENCGRAFFEKGNLKTHLRLHTGEKPYHCTAVGCDKAYATQGHLNDHFQKTHEKQYFPKEAQEDNSKINQKFCKASAQDSQNQKTDGDDKSANNSKKSENLALRRSYKSSSTQQAKRKRREIKINIIEANRACDILSQQRMSFEQSNQAINLLASSPDPLLRLAADNLSAITRAQNLSQTAQLSENYRRIVAYRQQQRQQYPMSLTPVKASNRTDQHELNHLNSQTYGTLNVINQSMTPNPKLVSQPAQVNFKLSQPQTSQQEFNISEQLRLLRESQTRYEQGLHVSQTPLNPAQLAIRRNDIHSTLEQRMIEQYLNNNRTSVNASNQANLTQAQLSLQSGDLSDQKALNQLMIASGLGKADNIQLEAEQAPMIGQENLAGPVHSNKYQASQVQSNLANQKPFVNGKTIQQGPDQQNQYAMPLNIGVQPIAKEFPTDDRADIIAPLPGAGQIKSILQSKSCGKLLRNTEKSFNFQTTLLSNQNDFIAMSDNKSDGILSDEGNKHQQQFDQKSVGETLKAAQLNAAMRSQEKIVTHQRPSNEIHQFEPPSKRSKFDHSPRNKDQFQIFQQHQQTKQDTQMNKAEDIKSHGRFKIEPLKLKNIQNNLDFEMNEYYNGTNAGQASNNQFAEPPLMKFDDINSSAQLDQTPMNNQGRYGKDSPPKLNLPDIPGYLPSIIESQEKSSTQVFFSAKPGEKALGNDLQLGDNTTPGSKLHGPEMNITPTKSVENGLKNQLRVQNSFCAPSNSTPKVNRAITPASQGNLLTQCFFHGNLSFADQVDKQKDEMQKQAGQEQESLPKVAQKVQSTDPIPNQSPQLASQSPFQNDQQSKSNFKNISESSQSVSKQNYINPAVEATPLNQNSIEGHSHTNSQCPHKAQLQNLIDAITSNQDVRGFINQLKTNKSCQDNSCGQAPIQALGQNIQQVQHRIFKKLPSSEDQRSSQHGTPLQQLQQVAQSMPAERTNQITEVNNQLIKQLVQILGKNQNDASATSSYVDQNQMAPNHPTATKSATARAIGSLQQELVNQIMQGMKSNSNSDNQPSSHFYNSQQQSVKEISSADVKSQLIMGVNGQNQFFPSNFDIDAQKLSALLTGSNNNNNTLASEITNMRLNTPSYQVHRANLSARNDEIMSCSKANLTRGAQGQHFQQMPNLSRQMPGGANQLPSTGLLPQSLTPELQQQQVNDQLQQLLQNYQNSHMIENNQQAQVKVLFTQQQQQQPVHSNLAANRGLDQIMNLDLKGLQDNLNQAQNLSSQANLLGQNAKQPQNFNPETNHGSISAYLKPMDSLNLSQMAMTPQQAQIFNFQQLPQFLMTPSQKFPANMQIPSHNLLSLPYNDATPSYYQRSALGSCQAPSFPLPTPHSLGNHLQKNEQSSAKFSQLNDSNSSKHNGPISNNRSNNSSNRIFNFAFAAQLPQQSRKKSKDSDK